MTENSLNLQELEQLRAKGYIYTGNYRETADWVVGDKCRCDCTINCYHYNLTINENTSGWCAKKRLFKEPSYEINIESEFSKL